MSRSRPRTGRGPYVTYIELRPAADPLAAARYPRTIPAIASLGRLALHPGVTFLVGENGSGKSTILEALAVAAGLNPEGGSKNFSFFALFRHRLLGPGFYLFDEPEAALSAQRQLALLALMHRQVLRGSQLVIATHSPILLAYPEAIRYELGPAGIREITYRETPAYRLTRAFLENPELSLRELFAEDEPA